MSSFLQDIRYAIRQLRRSPGFALTAILTLALGIGANTAVFSVVNSVLLRALPYPNAERLQLLWSSSASHGMRMFNSAVPDYRAWRDENHSFESMGAFSNDGISLSVDGQPPEELVSSRITASVFPTMGVAPILGRAFSERSEQWGEHRVAILSYGLWQRTFGGDANIVGRQIHLGGEIYTVVGVMPQDFRFFRRPVVIWTPLAFPPDDDMNSRNNHFVWVLGRLKPGVTAEQASSDVNVIAARIAKQFPENTGLSVRLQSVRDNLVGNVRPALLILFGAVLFVLLVACVNLANLLLSRAAARQREFAVRNALGASKLRLVRQFVSESLLIAILGGAAGVLLGMLILRIVIAVLPATFPTVQTVRMDPFVLGFTAGLALGSAFLFGVMPAFAAVGVNPQRTLHGTSRGATDGRGARQLRGVLLITEMALATALLAGAGLLLKSFSQLQRQDFGFDPEHVVTFLLAMDEAKYPKEQQAFAFVEQVTSKIQQLHGVRAAGMVNTLPLGFGMGWGKTVSGEGFPAMHTMADVPSVTFNLTSPGYLRAMGARLLTGRYFETSDTAQSPQVAIVNEAFARRFYPNQSVVGKTIRMLPPPNLIAQLPPLPPGDQLAPFRTVVGVIADLKNGEANLPADPEVFAPVAQFAGEGWGYGPMFAVRVDGDSAAVVPAIRNAVASLDPQQPVTSVATMSELLGRSVAQSRFNASLLVLFATLALLLAAVGIYGVISYGVSNRTQEIGVRMALGADRYSVLAMVLRESMSLTAIGLGAGLALAFALGRMIASLLFNTGSADLRVYGVISLVLVAVAVLAAMVPARRAASVEPMQALRAE